jgi:hypothetical protein
MKTIPSSSSYDEPIPTLGVVDETSSNLVGIDRPIGFGGSSIFEQSTRGTGGPRPPDLPYEAIYSATKQEGVVRFPQTTPSGVSGSPAASSRQSSGLGSSAYSTPLEGFDKESGSL